MASLSPQGFNMRLQGTSQLLTSLDRSDSAQRTMMATTQASQAVVPQESQIPRIMTGSETQLAKYAADIRIPEDAEIIAVVPKYRATDLGINSTETITYIYRAIETNTFSYVNVYTHFRTHDTFGVKLERTKQCMSLNPGSFVRKDTVLAQSPNVKDGIYSTTREGFLASVDLPECIEDGILIRRGFLEAMRPTAMSSASMSWGPDMYMKLIYGNGTRGYPLPGEKIRDDNLIMCLGHHDPFLDAVNMLPENITEPDYIHDHRLFASEDAVDASVYDISVYTNGQRVHDETSPVRHSEDMARVHAANLKDYYDRLLKVMRSAIGNGRKAPKLQRLFTDAMAHCPPPRRGTSTNLIRTIRGTPMDQWTVEVKYSWLFAVDFGAKLSTRHGCKGVACAIAEDDMMPRDKNGTICDLAVQGFACIGRMIIGQQWEQYINSASHQMYLRVRQMAAEGAETAAMWEQLMTYYRIVAHEMADSIADYSPAQIDAHVKSILKDRVHLVIPPDTDMDLVKMCAQIEEFVQPLYDTIWLPDGEGNMVMSEDPIRIGEVSITMLDKIKFSPMSVSSGMRNHYGLLCPINKTAKQMFPTNQQATRMFGESEVRGLLAALKRYVLPDIMDFATNPAAARDAFTKMFRAQNPMNVPNLICRKTHPYGETRPNAVMHHVVECAGGGLLIPTQGDVSG